MYEDAFYWVKVNDDITIARYYTECGSWEIIGSDEGRETEDFDEIGEKIEKAFVKKKEKPFKPLVEGKENKCGLNPPNTSHLRPPPPKGSGR